MEKETEAMMKTTTTTATKKTTNTKAKRNKAKMANTLVPTKRTSDVRRGN